MVRATIEDNLCLPSVDACRTLRLPQPRKRKKLRGTLEAFEIKASGIRQAVNQLSGGNRQK